MRDYKTSHSRSLEQPEEFWAEAAEALHWEKRWDKVLDESEPPFYRWFTGGRLNTCFNALDRHVDAGRGDQAAIIYDSPLTGTQQTITYRELLEQTAAFAGALAAHDVTRGDRVIVYMPMVPEAIVAVLACARIGAVHSVVFGGFASNELATRIDDAKPKAIVSASCGIEPNRIIPYKPMLDRAIDLARHKPDTSIILHWIAETYDAEVVAYTANVGQLGDGTRTSSLTPVTVSGLTDAAGISIGDAHSCALRVTGELGSLPAGQVGEYVGTEFVGFLFQLLDVG